jgi:hypothetical protein
LPLASCRLRGGELEILQTENGETRRLQQEVEGQQLNAGVLEAECMGGRRAYRQDRVLLMRLRP